MLLTGGGYLMARVVGSFGYNLRGFLGTRRNGGIVSWGIHRIRHESIERAIDF